MAFPKGVLTLIAGTNVTITNPNGPTATINASGGGLTVTAEAATFAAVASHFYYCDTTGGAIVATLPAPANGAQVIVKLVAGIATVTLTQHAAELIDGAATQVVNTLYQTVSVISDGTNWWVI